VGNIVTADDFESGTRAAIASGVTTVIDYTTQPPGIPLDQAVLKRRAEADGNVYCDYSLHCVIPSWKSLADPARQMRELASGGVPSFKLFMIYEDRGMQSDDGDLFAALSESAACGSLICVHAESERILKYFLSLYKNRPDLGAMAHALARPAFTEWEAVQRGLTWAEVTGGNIYFVHLSAGKSAEKIALARKAGVRALGETCPQYLTLDDSVFARPDGHLFATCPQIKKREDSDCLWAALKKGAVSVIATDSCTFNKTQKDMWHGDITKIPFGMPGVETSLALMYTRGVLEKKISLRRLTELMSLNPAKAMGLYPRKGTIKAGSDADLLIVDPGEERRVDHAQMQTRCDWNPYDGQVLRGFPEKVFLRGKLAARNGAPLDGPGGQFLPRSRPDLSIS
jgi:dihydropyrimidinase